MESYAIPLAALVIAIITFVATQIKGLQTANRTELRGLSDAVKELRAELADCVRMKAQLDSEIYQLKGENLRLFQRIDNLERAMR